VTAGAGVRVKLCCPDALDWLLVSSLNVGLRPLDASVTVALSLARKIQRGPGEPFDLTDAEQLCAEDGDELAVTATGPDAEAALDAVAEAFEADGHGVRRVSGKRPAPSRYVRSSSEAVKQRRRKALDALSGPLARRAGA